MFRWKTRLESIDADIESFRGGRNIPVNSSGARRDGMLIGALVGVSDLRMIISALA
jgi:hypothetical protein